jgi:hypothetical protein
MTCSYCGKHFKYNGTVFCNSCLKEGTRPRDLTVEQNVQVLKNLRQQILHTGLVLDDSDVIGAKHTHCTWGMCTNSKKVWDRPEYHVWPHSFKTEDRIAPLNIVIRCHFDRRQEGEHSGCYHECDIFSPTKERPSSEEVIAMIDRLISEYKSKSS